MTQTRLDQVAELVDAHLCSPFPIRIIPGNEEETTVITVPTQVETNDAASMSGCQVKEGVVPIRLLLVEDNPSDSLLLQRTLDSEYPGQYAATVTETLSEAKSLLVHQVFDVVLLDLSLPDSEGLGTIGQIAAAAPSSPIVVLTGVADEKIVPEVVHYGAGLSAKGA